MNSTKGKNVCTILLIITGYLMFSEAAVSGNHKCSLITNKMMSQIRIQSDDGNTNDAPMEKGSHDGIAKFFIAKTEDKEDNTQRIKGKNVEEEGSITSLPALGKKVLNRKRRSFSYKSICIPEITKICTMITYGGVTKPFCLYVKKNFCYGLD